MVDDELSRLPLWSLLAARDRRVFERKRYAHTTHGVWGVGVVALEPEKGNTIWSRTSHSVSSLGLASWLSGSESIILSITLIHSRTGCSAIPIKPRAKSRERHSRSCCSEVGPGKALDRIGVCLVPSIKRIVVRFMFRGLTTARHVRELGGHQGRNIRDQIVKDPSSARCRKTIVAEKNTGWGQTHARRRRRPRLASLAQELPWALHRSEANPLGAFV